MRFPLDKKVQLNACATEFLSSYETHTEIPLRPHPGSFGYIRKNHIHEGVDLYCEPNDPVYAIEAGVVVNIFDFTGEKANPPTPWWENTQGVVIQGENYTYNYGEILASSGLKIGDTVAEGQEIGVVKTVLKKNKGRPQTMLHLELYDKSIVRAIDSWELNTPHPLGLLDPTPLLRACVPELVEAKKLKNK